MKNHKDLLQILRTNGLRITPARRALLQFFLDQKSKDATLAEIHQYFDQLRMGSDRSSIYRNIETLKHLEIIQELNLPSTGKTFQYIVDRKVRHFFICKSCGKSQRGNRKLFDKIDHALQEIHGFKKANLSIVFYGMCGLCGK